MGKLLESALEYCRQGFSVIPLQPRGKKPLVEWTEYYTRKATEEEIREWWTKQPNANIGLVTGEISGMVVVDVDVHRGGDPKRVFDLAPTNMISRTGQGGYHLLYAYDNSLSRNKVGKNGVDVRSNGGQIVAPPSIHPNGIPYEWYKKGKLGRVTRPLISYIDLPSMGAGEEGNSRWLADALLGVGSGSRNDTCAKLAGYYAGKGIPKDVAIIMLSTWDSNNSPPLGINEITITVDSVYRTAYRHNPVQQQNTTPATFNVVGLDEYMVEYGDNAVTWIVPDWLPNQTITFVTSPPGTFKTWMLLDLAVSVASGTDFLGRFPIENKGPVLLIQQEDHHGGLAERIGTIINSRYNMLIDSNKQSEFEVFIPPKIPIYIHPDRQLKFSDPAVMDKLEEQIEKLQPRVVIIDPLYSAAETDDYMAKSASQMFRLKMLRDKYGCTFIIAHHKKKKAEGNEREGLWGSQFLNAFLETGWQVRSISETGIAVRRHFKVKKESTEIQLNFEINTEIYPYGYKVDADEDIPTEKEVSIVDLLTARGPMSVSDIAKELNVHRTTITRRIKAMEEDGVIMRDGEKKCRLISHNPEY